MSWNLARGEEFLPNFSLNELKQHAKAELEAKPKLRLLAAVHRKEGKSIDWISNAVGLHRRAVHDILHRFEERGLKAAQALLKPGRPKQLSEKQLQNLRKRLLQSPKANGFSEGFWNGRMVSKLVSREYKVKYSKTWLPKLLKRIGFSYKKPRATNPRRASDEEVVAFKKKRVERYWLPNEKEEPLS